MITDFEIELVSNSSGKVGPGNICVITVEIISQPSTKYTIFYLTTIKIAVTKSNTSFVVSTQIEVKSSIVSLSVSNYNFISEIPEYGAIIEISKKH